ncbi:MAG: GNAT family N-acetyltransferase [Flavobacterium sp. MedPE-SWcel]|uniref:GNAT family N-acetyltransferase n=1 Tax=uncultured Flavobacterium sp. TaxID=165435 RepID=UPI00092288E2|nr:GNAT family N-acetyltransferase [uncultured Flavobacterium sp.]OIQ15597.1 MAG: GNAT family N-acetyltransferase [Flavobacterium sp. MedPE-SWcel]
MKLEFKIKRFNEFSIHELYSVLQLRSEVFVVEQDCVYQDIDGKDEKALHLIGTYEGKTVAYARIFAANDYFEEPSIGRVVVSKEYRDKKWGHDLIAAAIDGIKLYFNTDEVTISAQLYLKKFYESHGFIQEGEGYLEDGIPHIKMKRK